MSMRLVLQHRLIVGAHEQGREQAILDVSNLQPASEGRIMVHNDLCSDLSDPTRINSKGAPGETPTSRQVLNP